MPTGEPATDAELDEIGDRVLQLVRYALHLVDERSRAGKPRGGRWRFDHGGTRFDLEAAAVTSELGTPDFRVSAVRGAADVEVGFTGAPAEVIAVTIVALFQAIREGNLPPA